MDEREIQVFIIRKLMGFKPPKWGASHTEETNLVKGLPKHLRGIKITKRAIKDLYKKEFLLRKMSTGEIHVSLNPRKTEEIMNFLEKDN